MQPLKSAEHTGAEMLRLVKSYAQDIGEMKNWNFPRFYNFVKNLEYRADPQGNEIISRPARTLQKNWPWRDCDDKAVLIGSWLWLNGIPFKFRASSNRPDKQLHHVYVVADFPAGQKIVDATYPKNTLGTEEPNTKIQELTTMQQANLHTFEGSEMGFSLKKLASKVKKIKVSNISRKVQNVAKKGAKLSRQVSNLTKNPAFAALINSVPGGAALIAANTKIQATLTAAKAAAAKNPSGAAAAAAAAAEQAAAAAESAKNQSYSATDDQKKALAAQANESALQAVEAAKIAAKAENRISTLSGASKVTQVIWTEKAEAAAIRAKNAADSIQVSNNQFVTDQAAGNRQKWLVPAAIGGAAIIAAFALKKKGR